MAVSSLASRTTTSGKRAPVGSSASPKNAPVEDVWLFARHGINKLPSNPQEGPPKINVSHDITHEKRCSSATVLARRRPETSAFQLTICRMNESFKDLAAKGNGVSNSMRTDRMVVLVFFRKVSTGTQSRCKESSVRAEFVEKILRPFVKRIHGGFSCQLRLSNIQATLGSQIGIPSGNVNEADTRSRTRAY